MKFSKDVSIDKVINLVEKCAKRAETNHAEIMTRKIPKMELLRSK